MNINTDNSAWPTEFLDAIEEHIIYALKTHLTRADAPIEALDLVNNLADLANFRQQSSPCAAEQVNEALSHAVQNLAALRIPFYSPYTADGEHK